MATSSKLKIAMSTRGNIAGVIITERPPPPPNTHTRAGTPTRKVNFSVIWSSTDPETAKKMFDDVGY